MSESTPARKPRRISAAYLERAGLHYLDRFASSAGNFRRVLMRKVDRAARFHGDDRAEGAALIEALIVRWRAAGLLDDRRFAEGRARSLHARGVSGRAIRGKLMAQGVAADDIDSALVALATEEAADGPAELEFRAACTFARRRRLGPWREEGARADRRERDLAALARAGFGYDVARRVIAAASPAELAGDMD